MPSLDVAHIREQGQNMLLFPLDSSFGHKSTTDQQQTLSMLTRRANAAGLAGAAVAFWQSGGRTHFMGPRPWRAFLEGLSMWQVQASVNRSISWAD
jgi:hypothetical protein